MPKGIKNGNSLADIEIQLRQNFDDYESGKKIKDNKRIYTTTLRFSEVDLQKICFLGKHYNISTKSGVIRKLVNIDFSYKINRLRK